jgi:hypothetical protein
MGEYVSTLFVDKCGHAGLSCNLTCVLKGRNSAIGTDGSIKVKEVLASQIRDLVSTQDRGRCFPVMFRGEIQRPIRKCLLAAISLYLWPI